MILVFSATFPSFFYVCIVHVVFTESVFHYYLFVCVLCLQQPFQTYREANLQDVPNRQPISRVSVCQRSDGCGCGQTTPSAQAQTAKNFPPNGGPRNFFKYSSNGDLIYVWPVWTIPVCLLTCIGLLITILIFLYLLFAYPVKGKSHCFFFF
jgi:hypothetical protein